ncbi:alpha/beta hydrolase [Paenibacillus sp. JX-17]|uniref:Alpha/beta hydrolase n=1 Tax=Paenibacillus lacisoli TaxID=3064525 RepID=A0ABT9CD79_9BACL|nr:alpha/beta hydrolase [Paenibacillus sp. JX-17]MDO7905548.1 alpha/beta hydrolase [Paenibacillus sp. JX-17]
MLNVTISNHLDDCCSDGSSTADAATEHSHLMLYPVSTGQPRPFILILPGGGYHHHAEHEGRNIAEWVHRLGMHAGVLHYNVKSIRPEQLIQDVEDSLRLVRQQKGPCQTEPDKIGMIGFSAGGHLAAISTLHGQDKPDLLILGYPVITMEENFAHQGSRYHLLGAVPSPEQLAAYSAEKQVQGGTPPVFIWTTADDRSVPVENSLIFAAALAAVQVPFELHIFEQGRHGLGLSVENPAIAQWVLLCERWLAKHHFISLEGS